MAEAPKGAYGSSGKGGGGSGKGAGAYAGHKRTTTQKMGGGFGFIAFIVFLALVGVALYMQIPRNAAPAAYDAASQGAQPQPAGENVLTQFFRTVFPGLYGGTGTTGYAQNIPPEQIPAGFTANDLAPYFKQIRIESFVAENGSGGELVIRNGLNYGVGLAGWTVRGSLGSQIIGLEGQNVGGELRLSVRAGVVAQAHDRVLLFDPRGKLVDEYTF